MRAVVDTNIWVSSFLSRRGAPAQLRAAHWAGRFTVVTSEPMLAEMADVLSRPKLAQRGINPEEVGALLAVLRSGGALAQVEGTVRVCRDPDDNVVIETAIRGGADVLVSGDHDLTQMVEVAEHLARAGIRVLTVTQFVQELNKPEETARV